MVDPRGLMTEWGTISCLYKAHPAGDFGRSGRTMSAPLLCSVRLFTTLAIRKQPKGSKGTNRSMIQHERAPPHCPVGTCRRTQIWIYVWQSLLVCHACKLLDVLPRNIVLLTQRGSTDCIQGKWKNDEIEKVKNVSDRK